MKPVSVIIPAYNPGKFLRPALASVFEQTFTHWELLVVDDGSTEDLGWIEQDFPAVRLIRQENSGSSVARNVGIMHSTGELIAFLDQDDVWLPEKLARQVAVMQANADLGMCHCDLQIIGAEGRVIAPAPPSETTDPTPTVVLDPSETRHPGEPSPLHRSILYFSRRFVVPSTVMFRRDCLAATGLLDPFIPFSGDYDFIIKLGSRFKVMHVPAVDVGYRKHGNNFSDQYDIARREIKMLTARYRDYALSQGDRPLAQVVHRLFRRPRRLFSAQAVDRARSSFHQGDYRGVVYHAGRALCFHPLFVLESFVSWTRAVYRRFRARPPAPTP